MITQVSKDKLKENRNLLWTKRGKAYLILIFSMNTNCESMAYRSFRRDPSPDRASGVLVGRDLPFQDLKLEVSEKLPQG